jgi:TonB family protein
LQAVLSSTGQVINIEVLQGLGYGLDKKAVEAVKGVLFIPAEKDGHPVSQYLKFEYSFDTGR